MTTLALANLWQQMTTGPNSPLRPEVKHLLAAGRQMLSSDKLRRREKLFVRQTIFALADGKVLSVAQMDFFAGLWDRFQRAARKPAEGPPVRSPRAAAT